MPRPLLEIWRDLNRDRDREPSSLLRQTIAKLEREMASPQYQARMKLNRAMEPKPLSLVAQATVRIGREMSSPEARRRQQLLKACGVAERVLGKPAPVQPTQPDETEKPKRKRASGAGRHPMLKQEHIDKGIDIARNNPTMSWKQLRWALREAGIDAGDTTLNTHIIRPARGLR